MQNNTIIYFSITTSCVSEVVGVTVTRMETGRFFFILDTHDFLKVGANVEFAALELKQRKDDQTIHVYVKLSLLSFRHTVAGTLINL